MANTPTFNLSNELQTLRNLCDRIEKYKGFAEEEYESTKTKFEFKYKNSEDAKYVRSLKDSV